MAAQTKSMRPASTQGTKRAPTGRRAPRPLSAPSPLQSRTHRGCAPRPCGGGSVQGVRNEAGGQLTGPCHTRTPHIPPVRCCPTACDAPRLSPSATDTRNPLQYSRDPPRPSLGVVPRARNSHTQHASPAPAIANRFRAGRHLDRLLLLVEILRAFHIVLMLFKQAELLAGGPASKRPGDRHWCVYDRAICCCRSHQLILKMRRCTAVACRAG